MLSNKFFPGTRRRFLLRLAKASCHIRKIQSAWTGLIGDLGLSPDAEKSLLGVEVEKLYSHLRSGDLRSYEFALEHLGHDLAGQGVPEEYAVAALSLFFEVCLCGSLAEVTEDKEYALGLTRLAGVSQLFLASGYATYREINLQALNEKLQRAEERAEALAIGVTEANEKERRRLASDLHDEIGHDLVVLKLYLEMIIADVNETMNTEARKRLTEASSLATRAIEAIRRLAFDLGPGIFDDGGFVPAIRTYARRFSASTGIKTTVQAASPHAVLQSREELALYRVLQGALSNVLRHARAKSVTIAIRSDGQAVYMTVEDDGKGFNVARTSRNARAAFGLQVMRERVELLGGTFQIHSPAAQAGKKKHGTRIEAVLPLSGRNGK